MTARALLEPQGVWQAAESELRPVLTRMYEVPAACLLIGGSKPS